MAATSSAGPRRTTRASSASAASSASLGRFTASADARRRAARALRRYALVLWWLLMAMLVAVLVAITQPPPEVVRLAPAEDGDPRPPALSASLAARVQLAPLDESILPAAVGEPPGLFVATGGLPLALRTAPSAEASVLVRVPDGAVLEDLGEITDDGAWRRVGWDGWEGWLAAGVLRRRP